MLSTWVSQKEVAFVFRVFLQMYVTALLPGVRGHLDDEIECPEHVDPELFFSSSTILIGTPDRALRTVPEGMVEVRPSAIPGAGLGAFAATFIPRHTWLGEYEGEFISTEEGEYIDSLAYAWKIYRDDEHTMYVDAVNSSVANWLRYINCPRHVTEENVGESTCYGRVYYRTIVDIAPGTELMVYYGDGYAESLGIDPNDYIDRTVCPAFSLMKIPDDSENEEQ